MVKALLSSCFVLCLVAPAAFGAWNGQSPPGTSDDAIAYAENKANQRVEIRVSTDGRVALEFRLASGFETFSESNCPTFQIDKRVPIHHFPIDQGCTIEAKTATYELGQIAERKLHSIILHRLMNGNELWFRYTIGNGQYREALFSLRASKQALRKALGYQLEVAVE